MSWRDYQYPRHRLIAHNPLVDRQRPYLPRVRRDRIRWDSVSYRLARDQLRRNFIAPGYGRRHYQARQRRAVPDTILGRYVPHIATLIRRYLFDLQENGR